MNTATNIPARQEAQFETVINEVMTDRQFAQALLSGVGKMGLSYFETKRQNSELKIEALKSENARLKGLVAGLTRRLDGLEVNLGKSKDFMKENRDRIKGLESPEGAP